MNTANQAVGHENRVPKVTWDFWGIKLLAVTMGETAADFLNAQLGLGLTNTSILMGVVLIVALVFQFRQRRYVPAYYWIAVVLMSIVGTLITDNLIDNFGYTLSGTTIAFSIVLAGVFAAWYAAERTLSIHTIFTNSREAFYWLAILFTFALGTAFGDYMAEALNLGYLQAGLIFGAVIAAIYMAYLFAGLNGILAFWMAYILTRPLGASFGDLLSQDVANGGMGWGALLTSAVFLGVITALIIYMTVTHDGNEVVYDDPA
jgi:uncharacterized membrane-anchored protein